MANMPKARQTQNLRKHGKDSTWKTTIQRDHQQGANYRLRMFLETLEMCRWLQMGQIQVWPNNIIVNTIQQLEDARQVDGNVQILLDLLDGRKHRMAAVARRGNEELKRCGEVIDRERWLMQWYEFCKQVWGWIRNQMAEQIQVLGPCVHQDVLVRLNNGCESFRGELETQLCGMSCSASNSSRIATICACCRHQISPKRPGKQHTRRGD